MEIYRVNIENAWSLGISSYNNAVGMKSSNAVNKLDARILSKEVLTLVPKAC